MMAAYIVLGLVLTAVLAELAARASLIARDRYYVHRPHAHRVLEIATDVIPQLEPRAVFRANADGERADPVPADPVHGAERWLVAGGSAAECFLLDQNSVWSAALQRELNARRPASARPVHVGNVARSLIPCRTIAALLARSLRHVRGLDTVVLMVGASDLVAWLERGTPEELPPPPPLEGIDLAPYAEENPLGPFSWVQPKRTAIYRLARRLGARFSKKPDIRQRAGGSIAKHRAQRAAARVLLDECPDPTAMLEAYRRDFALLIEVCRRHARRVIVARQPWLDRDFTPEEAAQLWNFGQGSPYRGAIDTYYTHRLVRELMRRIDDVSIDVARDAGAESVDLPGGVPTDFEHYYDFLHHTPKGAAVVARLIADGAGSPESDSLESPSAAPAPLRR